MLIAILREVSSAIGRCELTHITRQPIDIGLARIQHHQYQQALERLDCRIQCLPEEPALPDSVFVEDAAVVFDQFAIITRPGAESRRAEIPSIERVLQPYRKLLALKEPGTLDGGDVLCIGTTVYIGISNRSNSNAIDQMQKYLVPLGYQVVAVPVSNCLHLKSAVSLLAEDLILVNPDWVDASDFKGVKSIEIDSQEPYSANALWVNQGVIFPANFPRTQKLVQYELDRLGRQLVVVDVSELQKAEGAVTCCSLIFEI